MQPNAPLPQEPVVPDAANQPAGSEPQPLPGVEAQLGSVPSPSEPEPLYNAPFDEDLAGQPGGHPSGKPPKKSRFSLPRTTWLIIGGVTGVILLSVIGFILFRLLSGPTDTITVWTISGTETAVKEIADIYHKNNKKVNIKIVSMSPQGYEIKALFALAAQKQTGDLTPPDVWIIPNEWMPLHQSKFVAAPENTLDKGLGAYKTPKPKKGETAPPSISATRGRTNVDIISQDYPPIVKNDVVQGNQVWAVPLYMDTLSLLYDSSKISTPPTNWSDLSDLARRATQKNGANVSLSGVALGDNESVKYFPDILSILMLQSGTKMVDEPTKTATFNISESGGTPPGTNSLTLYTNFANPKSDYYSWNKALGTSVDALKNGKTLMAMGYFSDYTQLSSSLPAIKAAPLPQVDVNQPQTYGRYLVAGVTKQVQLPANPKKPDQKAIDRKTQAAWDFVSYFTNPDLDLKYANTLHVLPARNDVAATLASNSEYKTFLDQIPHAVNWKKEEAQVADSALSESVNLILKTAKPPQDANDVAAKAYTTFLQRDKGIETDPANLTFWQTTDDKADYRPAINEYANENKEIKRIVVSRHEPARYEWEALNAMAAHLGPDIFVIRNDWVNRYVPIIHAYPEHAFNQSGNVLDDETYLKRVFAPAVSTDGIVDGKLYAMPANFETLMLAFNGKVIDDLFDAKREARDSDFLSHRSDLKGGPNLWSDVTKFNALLTQKNGTNITLPFIALGTGQNVAHAEDIYVALLKQYGGEFSDPDRNTTGMHLPFSSRNATVPGKQALDFMQSFSSPDSPNYSWNNTMPNSLEALADGKVMAAFIYPRDIASMLDRNPKLSLDTYALPQLADNSDPIDMASYYTLTIPYSSHNPNMALGFVKYLVFKGERSLRTAGKSEEPTPTIKRSRATEPQSFQTDTAESYYKGRYPDEVNATIINMIDKKVSLDQAAAQINSILRRSFP